MSFFLGFDRFVDVAFIWTIMIVVAVAGARRCGKDVIADHLCNKHGFQKMRFADPLKRMVSEAFGFTMEQVDGHDKDVVDDTYGLTPRRVLQFMGTEIMQYRLREILPSVGRTFWARRLLDELAKCRRVPAKIVISDMRFMHEYRYLADELASRVPDAVLHVIKVERPRSDDRPMSATIDQHASETEWKDVPETALFLNDGTLDDLRKQVDEFARSL